MLSSGDPPPPAGDRLAVQVELPVVEGPPAEDLLGLLPRRYWAACTGGPQRDATRDLLHETAYSRVVFLDDVALAQALPFVDGLPAARAAVLPAPEAGVPVDRLERTRLARLGERLASAVGEIDGHVSGQDSVAGQVRGSRRAPMWWLGAGLLGLWSLRQPRGR
jgi:hypothetical protein